MTDDYTLLRKFIQDQLLGPRLQVNHLDITRSAILSITRQFEDLGWVVEPIEDLASRFVRNKIISPDGSIMLSMIGGKVYKHPPATEQICRRKHLTKRMLDLANLSTPAGGDFAPTEKEVAAAFFGKMPKPVVVKATDSGGSKGVTVGVRNREQFDLAWSHALADGRKSSNVLIEQYVDGVELRAFVIGDQVVSVVARIQPFVEGDGSSTLADLIEDLHKAREVHYRAKKMPVVVKWDFIGSQGYEATSVPAAGEIVFLNPFNTPTSGGFILDVTSAVCDEIKELSIRSMQAIPDLEVAGIDLMVSDLGDAETAYVIEVNTAASLELHRYPTHGNPRDVDTDIVNYFHAKYGKE